MTSIKITKFESEGTSAVVHWNIDGGDVKLLNLIFDQNGSCSNMSVDTTATSATMPYLTPGSQYSVRLSGLADTEWIHSDYIYVTI